LLIFFFFYTGVTLNAAGTSSDDKESFIIARTEGHKGPKQDFYRLPGMGSSMQVVAFILETWLQSISDCTKVNLDEGAPVNLGVLAVRSADCRV